MECLIHDSPSLMQRVPNVTCGMSRPSKFCFLSLRLLPFAGVGGHTTSVVRSNSSPVQRLCPTVRRAFGSIQIRNQAISCGLVHRAVSSAGGGRKTFLHSSEIADFLRPTESTTCTKLSPNPASQKNRLRRPGKTPPRQQPHFIRLGGRAKRGVGESQKIFHNLRFNHTNLQKPPR